MVPNNDNHNDTMSVTMAPNNDNDIGNDATSLSSTNITTWLCDACSRGDERKVQSLLQQCDKHRVHVINDKDIARDVRVDVMNVLICDSI